MGLLSRRTRQTCGIIVHILFGTLYFWKILLYFSTKFELVILVFHICIISNCNNDAIIFNSIQTLAFSWEVFFFFLSLLVWKSPQAISLVWLLKHFLCKLAKRSVVPFHIFFAEIWSFICFFIVDMKKII